MTHKTFVIFTEVTFDFIIVGAGTAGSHLASKLTEYFTSLSILLIEAGDDPGTSSDVRNISINHIINIQWSLATPNK